MLLHCWQSQQAVHLHPRAELRVRSPVLLEHSSCRSSCCRGGTASLRTQSAAMCWSRGCSDGRGALTGDSRTATPAATVLATVRTSRGAMALQHAGWLSFPSCPSEDVGHIILLTLGRAALLLACSGRLMSCGCSSAVLLLGRALAGITWRDGSRHLSCAALLKPCLA